jgi:hypothetical protein
MASRWQEWGLLALGIWLAASPWVLGVSAHHVEGIVAGALLAGAAVWSLGTPESRGADMLATVVGALVFFSPWLLGFSTTPLAYSSWLVGALAALLALWDLFFYPHTTPPQPG